MSSILYLGLSRSLSLRPSASRRKSLPNSSLSCDKNLDEWIKACGIIGKKVKIAYSNSNERGLWATDCIEKGEHFLYIPLNMCFISDLDLTKWMNLNLETSGLEWQVEIALKLLDEKKKGADSKWQCYLENLPQAFDLPIYWEKDEIQTICHLLPGYYVFSCIRAL